MKTFHAVMRESLRIPFKSILTLATVGLGIGVLILSLSVTSSFKTSITDKITSEGLVIHVANARYSADNGLEPVRPGVFDEQVMQVLQSDVSGVLAAAPLANAPWRTVSFEGRSYQVRRIIGSTSEYSSIMGLQMTAGSFFTPEDTLIGAPKAVISRLTAETLFSSPEEALGKTFQTPVRGGSPSSQSGGGSSSSSRLLTAQTYTIVGVFEDVDENMRRAYGIADMIVPYTSIVQGGQNIAEVTRSMLNTIAVRTTEGSLRSAESQIRDVLTRQYGADTALHVWEGQPGGGSSLLDETRRTVSTFTLVINLLGFVLLLTSSIGILSIMIVEVLGKSRDIAMQRALGASKRSIIMEFFFRSIFISSISALIGVIISYIFSTPLSGLIRPIVSGLGLSGEFAAVVTLDSIAIGVGAALVIGGLFGSLPVFSAFKAPISESIREN